jgi:hypothetical protein
VLVVDVGGHAGIPGDATSALVNITISGPLADGYATVYPCGSPRPTTSNINFRAGQTVANTVLATLGSGGKLCIYTSAEADIIVDVNGYADDGAPYLPLTPSRLADTRNSGVKVEGGTELQVPVSGRAGVPDDATAAVLNVAITEADAPGYATVYPCGTERPATSNVNYAAGDTTANAAVVGLDGGAVCIFTLASAHIVVDVNGAYTPSASSLQRAVAPYRLLDTREGAGTPVNAGETYVLDVAGRGGVEHDAIGAVLNLTIVGAAGPGFATVYPCGTERPLASNLNVTNGAAVANVVFAKLGAAGDACIYLSTTAHVVVDVNGAVVPAD